MTPEQKAELEAAIRWACGEDGSFPIRRTGQEAYYWRKELRVRANMPYAPKAEEKGNE